MSLQDKYRKISDRLIRAQTLRDEALRKLKEDFGLDSVEEAEQAIEKIEAWIEKKEAALESRIEQFEKEYGDLLKADR